MRAMIFGEDNIRRVCGPLTLSVAAWLAQTPSADASIMVRLQQVNSSGNPVSQVLANPNPSQQTLVYADLIVSGSGSPLPVSDLFSFATVLTWSTSSGVTNLYTVNSSGSPFIGSGAVIVNEPGFLFANTDDPATSSMNVTAVDPDSQRYLFVENFELGPTLTDPIGDITIARLRFAVSAGINEAVFSFALNNNTGSGYGFLDKDVESYTFVDGGGTIAVVPEPGTLKAGLLGIAMLGASVLRQRVRRRRNLAHATIT
jgi:hypothetical protein